MANRLSTARRVLAWGSVAFAVALVAWQGAHEGPKGRPPTAPAPLGTVEVGPTDLAAGDTINAVLELDRMEDGEHAERPAKIDTHVLAAAIVPEAGPADEEAPIEPATPDLHPASESAPPQQVQPEPRPRPDLVPPPPGPAPDESPTRQPQLPGPLEGPIPRSTLRVEDQELREVFEVLASQAGVNIVVAPNVQGRVSLNLRDVTFDQALDVLLKQANLTARREKNIIYVHTLDGMAALRQSERRWEVRVITLNHARASDLVDSVRPLLSPDGAISATPGGRGQNGEDTSGARDTLVVRDYPEYLAQIEGTVRLLDVRPPQVLIEALVLRVAPANRHAHGPSVSVVDHLDGPAFLGPRPPVMGPSQIDLGTRCGVLNADASGVLQRLRMMGQVTVLASPRLLVLNKKRAAVHVGRKMGYVDGTARASNAPSNVRFLDVGTILTLRPFISGERMVRLEIHPEKSAGFVDGHGLPQARTAEVTTSMLVPDGATLVLGGLIEGIDDAECDSGKLGHRFSLLGSKGRSGCSCPATTELVVLITPRLLDSSGPATIGGDASPMPPMVPGFEIAPVIELPPLPAPSDASSTTSSARAMSPRGPTSGPRTGSDPSVTRAGGAEVTAPRGYRPGDLTRALADRLRGTFTKPDARKNAGVVAASHSGPLVPPWPAVKRDEPVPFAPPREVAHWHTVQPGEEFASIARAHYGSALLGPALWEANRDVVPCARALRPGQSIALPPPDVLEGAIAKGLDAWPTSIRPR